jgi:hypothetical protein
VGAGEEGAAADYQGRKQQGGDGRAPINFRQNSPRKPSASAAARVWSSIMMADGCCALTCSVRKAMQSYHMGPPKRWSAGRPHTADGLAVPDTTASSPTERPAVP